ncbi:hypothetical protein ACFLXQ_07485 [Chloroflexota bacterium]
MIRLKGTEKLFISKDLIGYADKLTQEGVVPRRVDLLLLGFSYAIENSLNPADKVKRHEIIQAYLIDDERLAIEAVAHWYAREIGHEELEKESKLLEFICMVGVSGLRELQKRWEQKSKSQIQWDIMQLATGSL